MSTWAKSVARIAWACAARNCRQVGPASGARDRVPGPGDRRPLPAAREPAGRRHHHPVRPAPGRVRLRAPPHRCATRRGPVRAGRVPIGWCRRGRGRGCRGRMRWGPRPGSSAGRPIRHVRRALQKATPAPVRPTGAELITEVSATTLRGGVFPAGSVIVALGSGVVGTIGLHEPGHGGGGPGGPHCSCHFGGRP